MTEYELQQVEHIAQHESTQAIRGILLELVADVRQARMIVDSLVARTAGQSKVIAAHAEPTHHVHEVVTFGMGQGDPRAMAMLAMYLDRRQQEHGATLLAAIPMRIGGGIAVPGRQPEMVLQLVLRRPASAEEWAQVQAIFQQQREAESRAEAASEGRVIQ